ncbi:MAG: TIGR03936 family radical SAM-associated protein [Coriobacteriia bacterium]|nr:TIGR03936 family radical SAM-associated protein [Coriobacteriia bacterium]
MKAPLEFRLRVAYAKEGRGAYLSHLEVIRALERTVRRATLPYAITQGFSPHMRIAFGPALGLGVASRGEYFDLIVTEFVEPTRARARLQDAATDVLPVRDCAYVPPKDPSLNAACTIFRYEVSGMPLAYTRIDAQTAAISIEPILILEQKGKMREFVTADVLPEGVVQEGETVRFTIRASSQATLRPDTLVRYLLGDAVYAAQAPTLRTVRTEVLTENEDGTWQTPLGQALCAGGIS